MITTDLFRKMLKEDVPPIQFIKKGVEDDSSMDKIEGESNIQLSIYDLFEVGENGGVDGNI